MSEFASCRILVISSTTDQAQQFVQRVKALRSDSIDFESTGQQTPVLTNTSDNGSICIPWTIVNKYYTADVHFEIRELQSFSGDHASEVPAIIYVWSCGEPYQDYVSTLSQKLQHHDPEVSLAVRLGGASSVPAEGKDAEDGLDEFLSSHGLEYVDGDRDGAGYLDEDRSGVPGLPRVIDALSTIMWPSLVQSAATSARKSRARELLDWARVEEADDGLRALISSNDDKEHEVGSSGADAAPKKSRMQREMDELEKWLEEDDIGRRRMDDAQAWIARDDATDGWSDIPTPMIRTPGGDQTFFGFDDDFSEFVGAPMDVTYGHEAVRQKPMQTGASYRTLASEFEVGDDVFGEDGDLDLPSHAEIQATSKLIFGTALDVPTNIRTPSRSPSMNSDPLPGPATSNRGASPGEHDTPAYHPLDDDSFSTDHELDDDDDFELSAFDLSRVLGALQGMKEEIAGMQDEGERRKAAARVALGLVHALRKENDRELEAGVL